MDDFEERIRGIAQRHPTIMLCTALALIDAGGEFSESDPPVTNDPFVLAEWGMGVPAITSLIRMQKKINAIREMRAMTQASLLASKHAIEMMQVRMEAKGE